MKNFYKITAAKLLILIGVIVLVFYIVYLNYTHASTLQISAPASNTDLTGPNSGLVGWWTFDGKNMNWTSAFAGTALDSSGGGNSGTLTDMDQATTTVPGKIGQALFFNSAAQHVDVAGTLFSGTPATLTFSAWVRFNSFVNSAPIIKKFLSNQGLMMSLQKASGINGIDCQINATTVNSAPSLGQSVSDGSWHFVACIWNGSTISSYIDGTQGSGVSVTTYTNPSSDLFIGNIGGTAFSGSIDDVRVYSRALSTTELAQLYNLGHGKTDVSTNANADLATSSSSVRSGLVGWWTFDGNTTKWTSGTAGTAIDSSGNGHTGTLTSMVQASSTIAGKIGQALNFMGASTLVNISSTFVSTTVLGSAYTACAWAMTRNNAFLSTGNSLQKIIDLEGSAASYGFAVGNDGGSLLLLSVNNSVVTPLKTTSNTVFLNNKWVHVCDVYTSAGGSVAYVNGVVAATTADSGKTLNGTLNTLYIGAGNGANFWLGRIDDVRIYNRALSATEIMQLYNIGQDTMDVSSTANTDLTGPNSGQVGWWTFDGKNMNWTSAFAGTAVDSSGAGNTGTLTEMGLATSTVLGKLGQALSFNGVNSTVCMANSTSLDITGAMSISAWIDPTGFGGASKGRILDKDTGSAGYMFLLDNANVASGFGFGVNSASLPNNYEYSAANSITLNKWQHVVVTYNGAGTVLFYVNGAAVASGGGGITSTPADSSATSACIGSSLDTASRFFPGVIDDVRIYNRVLSPTEVQQLYNIGK